MRNTKYKKIIIIISALAGILILYFLVFYEKKLPRPEIKNRPNLVTPKNHNYSFENPPVFQKEGELSFIDADNKKLISEIDIEIADSRKDHALGLMFRPEMEKDHGMLFVFGQERIQSFWMKNTLISLDILYVNREKKIVDIYKNTKIRSEKTMPSAKPAIYVVEVNAGYCDSLNIETGDFVEF